MGTSNRELVGYPTVEEQLDFLMDNMPASLKEKWIEITSPPKDEAFKVGDWVNYKGSTGKIISIQTQICVQFTGHQSWYLKEHIELWTPAFDEVCCFTDNDWNDQLPVIGKFTGMNIDYNTYFMGGVEEPYDNAYPLEYAMTLKDK